MGSINDTLFFRKIFQAEFSILVKQLQLSTVLHGIKYCAEFRCDV